MTKQELIDHLQHLEKYTHYSEDAPALREVIEMLKCSEMPNGSDTISRKKAIDICTSAIDLWSGQIGEGALAAVRDKIAELPSAQPEVIRCKDCKWFGRIGCAISIVDDSDKPTENDFCSFAERKEE